MQKLNEIVNFLDTYLDTKNVKDGSWNGLQVEGKSEIKKIMFAVDASMDTFKKAVELNADMIVVHHGHFWVPANPSITGYNKERIEFLLKHNVSLYASHLPLDKHPESGNNAQLLKVLGFEKDKAFGFYYGETISFIGKSEKPRTIQEIESILKKELHATCKILPFGKKEIRSIAVCSGGGDFATFTEALNSGVDLYLTGDSTEVYFLAKDAQFNVIFAGHHATEIVGVKALSQLIGSKFDIETEFVDLPTGL